MGKLFAFPRGVGGGCPGPPALWQREARAVRPFGDEPFPRIKEGKFGVGWAKFSIFISHSSADHRSDAALPPPFPFPSPWTAGRGGGG